MPHDSSMFEFTLFLVTLTMTLSGLSVIFANDDDTIQHGEAELAAAYQVSNTDRANDEKKLSWSLTYSRIMGSIIAAMTFVIVLLYKFE